VNLESRGTTGPAIMFETSRPNGRSVRHYARSVDRPAGNSLTTDFSRLIPNQTDVAVLKERPWTILNFAVIGNETRYHSPDDTIANLDPRSLRHMGEQALQVTADLAGGGPAPADGQLIYADILGIALVTLPLWLGLALLGALLLGFAWLAWSRRGGVGRGSAAFALAMADAALTAFLLHWLIGRLRPGEYWRASPEWISLAIDATAMASAAVALLWIARGVPRDRLRLAFWLVYLVLGAAICLLAPGAAIYFLLPPLLAGAGLLWPRVERIATGARAPGPGGPLAAPPPSQPGAARFRRRLDLRSGLGADPLPLPDRGQAGAGAPGPGPGDRGDGGGGGARLAAGGAGARLFGGAQAAAEPRICLGRGAGQGAVDGLSRPRAAAPGFGSRGNGARRGGALVELQEVGDGGSRAGGGAAGAGAARRAGRRRQPAGLLPAANARLGRGSARRAEGRALPGGARGWLAAPLRRGRGPRRRRSSAATGEAAKGWP
jgi:hypothetical protein